MPEATLACSHANETHQWAGGRRHEEGERTVQGVVKGGKVQPRAQVDGPAFDRTGSSGGQVWAPMQAGGCMW